MLSRAASLPRHVLFKADIELLDPGIGKNVMQPGYGADGFRPDEAPRPLERATNAGFLIVTIEFDCQGPEQFEENLIWIRSPDGDGDFARSPFADLDRDLQGAKGVSRLLHRVQRQ